MSPAIRASENALFNAYNSRLMLLLAAPSSCRFAIYSKTSVFIVEQPIQDLSAVSFADKTVGIRLPRLWCGA